MIFGTVVGYVFEYNVCENVEFGELNVAFEKEILGEYDCGDLFNVLCIITCFCTIISNNINFE